MKLNPYAKIKLEQMVYALTPQYCKDYTGGSWAWTRAGYWRFKDEPSMQIVNHGNGFAGKISSEVASIAINIIACNQIAIGAANRGDYEASDTWSDYQMHIRDQALEKLTERKASQLLEFID